MPNDIDGSLFGDEINLSKIGKYDKFIDFGKWEKGFFTITLDDLTKEKFHDHDGFPAMERMQAYVDMFIETELKKNTKLQSKIKEIENKAKKRIEKLKEKPKKKIQKKFGYERFEAYFEPKLDCEEVFLDPS